jgi:large-conductance mechanosensitive channel
MQQNQTSPLIPLITVITIIVLILSFSFIFEIAQYPFWIKEGGVIEKLSVVGYLAAAMVMIVKGGLPYIIKYFYFFIPVLLFAMRELDFHKKFTTMGMFKSKFYLSSSVPFTEKFIGFLVIVFLVYLIIKIINNHAKDFLRSLQAFSAVHVGVALIFLTLFFAKAIDGLDRKLELLNITITEETSTTFEVIEEVLEMGIPLLIIATVMSYFLQLKSTINHRK